MGALPAAQPTQPASDEIDFVEDVREVCGAEVARLITERFGGTSHYFPVNPQPHHVISKLVGIDAAREIAKKIGFGRILVPLGSCGAVAVRKALIERLCLEGKSVNAIARTANCAERTVYNARARLRREGKLG